jgi:hypothetical protein
MIMFTVGSQYAGSPESDEELRLLGDTAGLYSLMIVFAVGSRYAESPESDEDETTW